MGLLDLITGNKTPQYQAPEMDAAAKDAFNNSMGNAQRAPEEFKKDLMAGTDQGAQAMQTPDQQAQHLSAMGSGNQSALYQALSNKTNRMMSSNDANLNRTSDIQSVQNKWNALAPASSFAHAMMGVDQQNQQMALQNQIMKSRARSGALSSLLGAGGMAGGMAAAGMFSSKKGKSYDGGDNGEMDMGTEV